MKNSLSDLYEQVLLNEAEKHSLQNPSQDEVGSLKSKQELFGTKPKAVEGPDKAKLKQGPKYAETTGSASKPAATNASMPNSAPAKETKPEEGKEMKDTDVDPTNKDEDEENDNKKKKEHVKEEGYTMSAFETLFKKTITEEVGEEASETEEPELEEVSEEEEPEMEASEDELEEEESDLISDLRDLQDRLSSILSKLEDVQAEEESLEGEESYSEEDFDEEFSEEEPMKESVDKPKALNNSKGKVLMSKKNKVGKVNPKGGKANAGKIKSEPTPKALGDKKAHLQKGKPEVKSSVKKGDFIK